VRNEANWACTAESRRQRPRSPEELGSFLCAHPTYSPLQVLSGPRVTLILTGGELGSFCTSISLETCRFRLALPAIGFVSHNPSSRKVSWADGGRFSCDSRQRESYLTQGRRDAEHVVNRILCFSAPPCLGASQFRLRLAAALGLSSSTSRTAAPGEARIDHPGCHTHFCRYNSFSYVECQMKSATATISFSRREQDANPRDDASSRAVPLRGDGGRARRVYRIPASGSNANEAFAHRTGRCRRGVPTPLHAGGPKRKTPDAKRRNLYSYVPTIPESKESQRHAEICDRMLFVLPCSTGRVITTALGE